MNVDRYLEALRGDLALAAAAGGPEAEHLAERMTAPLESALRLVLQDALSDAAQEISRELAPGSVELRLRGRELGFAVTPAPAEASVPAAATPALTSSAAGAEGGDGGTSRISFRPPERLKAQIEEAAEREGQSVNAFLVSTLTAALAGSRPPSQPASQSPNHVVGWVS